MLQKTTAQTKIKALRKRIRIVQGGTSSSKTFTIIPLLIQYAIQTPNSEISVVAESIPHLKRGALKDFLKIMDWTNNMNHDNFNKSNLTYKFSNGSYIEFFSADQPDKLRGARRDILFINECNNVSFESYQQLAIRTKKFIYLDYNPTNEFWVHTELMNEPNSDFIILTYKDNEALDPAIVKEIEKAKEKAETSSYWDNWWKVYGLGQIGSIEGRIFTHFQRITYNDYLTKPFKTVYAIDFGKNDPTAIIEGKFDRAFNNLYVNELNYASENQVMMNLSDVDKQKLNSEPNGGVVVYLLTKLGVPKDAFLVCDSARPDHILTLRRFGWEYAYGIDKPKGSIMHGISQLQATNVFYTENSNNLDFEYQNYQYKKDRLGVIDDEAEDENNHLMDALRYLRRHFEKNN